MRTGETDLLHPACVDGLIALSAGCVYGRAAARIECFLLERGLIGVKSHFAAEGIELINEVRFGEPADRGIARHTSDRIDATCDQECFDAHSGGDQGRFGAGVSAADHDDIR